MSKYCEKCGVELVDPAESKVWSAFIREKKTGRVHTPADCKLVRDSQVAKLIDATSC